jgi:hypothetical protein
MNIRVVLRDSADLIVLQRFGDWLHQRVLPIAGSEPAQLIG